MFLLFCIWYKRTQKKWQGELMSAFKCTKCIQYFTLFVFIENILLQNMKLKNIVLFPLEIWKNIYISK